MDSLDLLEVERQRRRDGLDPHRTPGCPEEIDDRPLRLEVTLAIQAAALRGLDDV